MRILVLTNFYPPISIGGYEIRCKAVVDYLLQNNHEVTVVTSNGKEENITTIDAAMIHRVLHLETPLDYYNIKNFFFNRNREEKENLDRLRKITYEVRPDLIFIWGMWNLDHGLAAWLENEFPKLTIYSVCDYWPLDPGMHVKFWAQKGLKPYLRPIRFLLSKVALKKLDLEGKPQKLRFEHVITVSRFVKEYLIKKGLPLQKAKVILNGIKIENYHPNTFPYQRNPGSLKLIYVGGLSKHKGIHTAIQAMGIVSQRQPELNLRLDIAGKGHPDYESQLKNLCSQLRLGQKVQFLGCVLNMEIPHLLTKYDGCVFPSEWEEPLASTPMEAMACQIPVIGTLTGGSQELFQPEINSLIFSAGNAEELANCMIRLASDPILGQRIAEAGRNTIIQYFNIDDKLIEFEEYLLEVFHSSQGT